MGHQCDSPSHTHSLDHKTQRQSVSLGFDLLHIATYHLDDSQDIIQNSVDTSYLNILASASTYTCEEKKTMIAARTYRLIKFNYNNCRKNNKPKGGDASTMQ